MADLKVDYEQLEASHEAATKLKSEFDDLPDQVGHHEQAWGDNAIKDAMHKFANNWDYRRDVLSDDIKEFGEKVEGCLETFKQADQKLYDAITKEAK